MQDFLKGIKNKITTATTKVGDFFKPVADQVRIRDVAREAPKATIDLGKEIIKGGARFAKSAGEGIATAPLELNAYLNPGTKLKVKMYEPEKIPGLGFLGPIESYQNQAKREATEGKNKGVSLIKAAGNIALDEPVGVALKPLGLAFGAMMKSGAGKQVERTLAKLVDTIGPEEVKSLLSSIGIGEKAAIELSEPLAKAKTLDEVKGILGYTEKTKAETAKKGREFFHGTDSSDEILQDGFKIMKPIHGTQIMGEGIYLTPTKEEAKNFGKNVLSVEVNPKVKIYETNPGEFWSIMQEASGKYPGMQTEKAIAKMMQERGYGAIQMEKAGNKGETYLSVFDPKNLKINNAKNMEKGGSTKAPVVKKISKEEKKLAPIENYSNSEPGKFWAPEGSGYTDYGPKKTSSFIDENTLFKGPSSWNYAKENELMDKPFQFLKKEYGADTLTKVQQLADDGEGVFSKDPNLFYKAFQDVAEKDLKEKGYKGAYWSSEDELSPRQYQVWDQSAISKISDDIQKKGKGKEGFNVDEWLDKNAVKVKTNKPEKITLKELFESKADLKNLNEDGDLIDYREPLQELIDKGYGNKSITEIINDDAVPNIDKGELKYIKKYFADDLAKLSTEGEIDQLIPALRNTGLYERKAKQDFTGVAKKLGLDKEGIDDKTVEWVEDWVNRYENKKIYNVDVPESIQKTIGKYKSNEPITLYRGLDPSKEDGVFTSWTYDKKVADRFANRIDGGKGTVITKTFTPDEVIVDFTKVPDNLLAKATKLHEQEVIVRNKKDTGTARSIGDIMKSNGGQLPPPETPRTIGDMLAPKGAERKFITRIKAEEPGMKDLLQGQYERKSNVVLKENADKLIKENYNAAETMARTGVDDQAVAVASRMIEDELNIAKKATDEATKNKAYEKAAEIANDAARNLTEAGRAVQAASLLGKMTPEGMARYAARKIQKYNEEAGARTMKNFMGGAKKIPELTPEQIKEIADGMEKINKMEEGIEKARELQKLGEKIQSYIPSTLYQKILNVWKAGLLTGLKTTGVNVASNISHSLTEIVKDVPASIVDKIVSMFTGKRTLVFTGKGTGSGAAEGIKKGWDFLKTGFDERNIAGKLDYKKVNFGKGKVADALKKYTDTVFGVLGAEDQPFYYAARARSMANQAAAMAKNEGLRGKEAVAFAQKLIENPTEDMLKYSALDAETAVFQQDSWLAKKAQNMQKGLEVVLPFAKTPANVATAMINYTPVGIAKTIIENIGKGRFDQRLFAQGMGRGITGTALVAVGAALVANKMLNLSTPTSEKERKQWELEGRTPNSILINGKWRNIGVLGPAGMVLVIGGHLQQGMEKTGSLTGGLAQAAGGFGSALTEQSFLSGVNKAIDAIKDPTRSFNGFASGLAGSLVPTIVADFARLTDQYERRTDGMVERVQSRVPGLRNKLQPQIDTLGNAKETPNFFEVMADPTRPGNASAEEGDVVVAELRRLADAGYQATPTQVGEKAGYPSLTPEQNTMVLEMTGRYAKNAIRSIMDLPAYDTMDNEQRMKTIENVVDNAKVEGRARALVRILAGLRGKDLEDKIKQLRQDKMITNQVYGYYQSLK